MHDQNRTAQVHDEPAEVDAGGPGGGGDRKPPYVLEVDGVDYGYDRPTITGAEIMALADIPPADGLVQVLPDEERKTILPDDIVHLAPRTQFKWRPRFKRG